MAFNLLINPSVHPKSVDSKMHVSDCNISEIVEVAAAFLRVSSRVDMMITWEVTRQVRPEAEQPGKGREVGRVRARQQGLRRAGWGSGHGLPAHQVTPESSGYQRQKNGTTLSRDGRPTLISSLDDDHALISPRPALAACYPPTLHTAARGL